MSKRLARKTISSLPSSSGGDALLKCLRPLGVGVSPSLRCHPCFNTPPRLALCVFDNVLPACPLAVVPDTAVWTVGSVHDSDVDGVMPPPEVCLAALPPGQQNRLFEAYYLALYFAFNACRNRSTWSAWQTQQMPPNTTHWEGRHVATAFLRSLSQVALTPPLDIFISMSHYAVSHSCRLSRDGSRMQIGGPTLALLPVVDATLIEGNEEANVSLQKCDARHVRNLKKTHPLLYARRCLQSKSDEAGYWVLQTTKSVAKGERLILRYER
ncbi:hypothetical protein DQ04_02641060 [Trypanosoma grayi]|uniref:hypothetical protein n=1 Tax=Trypanosoma grayi TaxID=71804 RepID=UPI0004F411C6|nr:hypothetical protein DQ04_02641060 [Trypanosoma grayi]KEG11419.1 hypothetical protein DQ04_02641060 [Trypanosoma grayi]